MSMSRSQYTKFLYKSILRLHRGLPKDMKLLGDEYVKSEFKRHKSCSDGEAILFLNEWMEYAIQLGKQLSVKQVNPNNKIKIGTALDDNIINKLPDDQIIQLYELMKAAKKEETNEKG